MPVSTKHGMIHTAKQIMQYFKDHPKACDTVEGITKWWLIRQRFEVSVGLVQQALDYLVAESMIERKSNIGGEDVYSLAQTQSKDQR
jgi:hypothetical protein